MWNARKYVQFSICMFVHPMFRIILIISPFRANMGVQNKQSLFPKENGGKHDDEICNGDNGKAWKLLEKERGGGNEKRL